MKHMVKHDLFVQEDTPYFTIRSIRDMQDYLNISYSSKLPSMSSYLLTALQYHHNEHNKIHGQVLKGLGYRMEITSVDLLNKISEFDCTLIWGDNDQGKYELLS